MPLVSRTRATLRSAEFGFLGVVVYTRVQTPRRWGEPFSAGVLDLSRLVSRLLRTNCWIVGTVGLLARRDARIDRMGPGRRRVHGAEPPAMVAETAWRLGPRTASVRRLRRRGRMWTVVRTAPTGAASAKEDGAYSPVPVPSRSSGTAVSTAAGSASSAGAAVAVELASHSARSTSSASLE